MDETRKSIGRQLSLGIIGGAVSVCLTLWLRFYIPETDSFADIRDAPTVLLAFFGGPFAALVAGVIAAVGRAMVGLFSGVGSSTWFGSSLATLCATFVAVLARRFVFRWERPSFALAATMAAIVEMLHMAVVLSIGFADFSNAFAVILAAIPFQCGGTAALAAVVSLALNRRQDGRENMIVSVLVAILVTFVVIVYFAMAVQAENMELGLMPMTADIYEYPCHLATVLYGIVLSVLMFFFVAYMKRTAPSAPTPSVRRGVATAGRVRIGLRGKFAISLAAMLCVIGALIGWIVAVDARTKYEGGYAENALFVADSLSKFIDGERVRRYLKTNQKDEYYHEVLKLMKSIRVNSEIRYFFVATLDGQDVVYVWDTGECDLGIRDHDFEDDEIRNCSNVMRQRVGKCCFVHRSETYGYLMSAIAPILGADGKPVAFTGVDVLMDYIDEQINRLVCSVVLLTLSVVLVSLAGYYFFVSRFIVSPAERQLQAEEERIHAELNVARKIQTESLPNVFPPFPEHPEVDIYAMMVPAKEVGGDFYDFFLVDPTHLAVVIGDVSDKGVPAALFMMTTKTLIKARAQRGGTPAEILGDVNDRLCEGNDSGMFVTLYLAVIDLTTGEGLAVNAGHEHPAVRRLGGAFELVKYAHDPMLGLMPSLAYTNRPFRLASGESLVIYTDGVTEAKDVSGGMYGEKGMIDALGRIPGGDCTALLKGLYDAVRAHIGAAAQFDDITMLAVTYRGGGLWYNTLKEEA